MQHTAPVHAGMAVLLLDNRGQVLGVVTLKAGAETSALPFRQARSAWRWPSKSALPFVDPFPGLIVHQFSKGMAMIEPFDFCAVHRGGRGADQLGLDEMFVLSVQVRSLVFACGLSARLPVLARNAASIRGACLCGPDTPQCAAGAKREKMKWLAFGHEITQAADCKPLCE